VATGPLLNKAILVVIPEEVWLLGLQQYLPVFFNSTETPALRIAVGLV
jgi:hypothetical protein